MEALSKVKKLFPNLADISPGEIAALFERFDGRTRDDAGAFEDLPAGSSDAGWLGLPFTEGGDEEEWALGPFVLPPTIVRRQSVRRLGLNHALFLSAEL